MGKIPSNQKNGKYVPKTYTFEVTKCDEIFDLLVVDGQVIAPKRLEIPPLEQHKKRGFCKFHNFFGTYNVTMCSFQEFGSKSSE